MEASNLKDFLDSYNNYESSFSKSKEKLYALIKDYVSFSGTYADVTGPYSEDNINDICFRRISIEDDIVECTFIVYKSGNGMIYAEELVIGIPIESFYANTQNEARKIWASKIAKEAESSAKEEILSKINSLKENLNDIESKKEAIIKEIENLESLSNNVN